MSGEGEYEVIIVGAGFSGLTCAYSLVNDHNVDPRGILILEAHHTIGGRCQQDNTFFGVTNTLESETLGITIELGAEAVHGRGTSLTKIIDKINSRRKEKSFMPLLLEQYFVYCPGDGGPAEEPVNGKYGLYCIKKENGTIQWFKYDSKDEDFQHGNHMLHELENLKLSSKHRLLSMNQYLKNNNVKPDIVDLLEAGFANTFNSTMENLSFHRIVEMEKYWCDNEEDGDGWFVKGSYGMVLEYLSQNLNIKTSSIAQRIDYSHKNKVIVTTKDGTKFTSKKVVVSASPAVLKANLIEFVPQLPALKLNALSSLDIRRMIKIFALFNKPCWPTYVDGIICAKMPIPEIWFKEDPENGIFLATGFLGANAADKLLLSAGSNNRENFAVQALMKQLTELFNPKAFPFHEMSESETVENKASWSKPGDCFVKGIANIWDEVSFPYVRGGYHSPKVSNTFDPGYPSKLAEPVENRLFFCGEATNVLVGTTVQSAMDSGIRAANQIRRH